MSKYCDIVILTRFCKYPSILNYLTCMYSGHIGEVPLTLSQISWITPIRRSLWGSIRTGFRACAASLQACSTKKKMQAICKHRLSGRILDVLDARKLLILLVELRGIEPLTSWLPACPDPFRINNLRVFLQEIPTYSNLCNLQMQAKRKHTEGDSRACRCPFS